MPAIKPLQIIYRLADVISAFEDSRQLNAKAVEEARRNNHATLIPALQSAVDQDDFVLAQLFDYQARGIRQIATSEPISDFALPCDSKATPANTLKAQLMRHGIRVFN